MVCLASGWAQLGEANIARTLSLPWNIDIMLSHQPGRSENKPCRHISNFLALKSPGCVGTYFKIHNYLPTADIFILDSFIQIIFTNIAVVLPNKTETSVEVYVRIKECLKIDYHLRSPEKLREKAQNSEKVLTVGRFSFGGPGLVMVPSGRGYTPPAITCIIFYRGHGILTVTTPKI